jgi:hypothetical protein
MLQVRDHWYSRPADLFGAHRHAHAHCNCSASPAVQTRRGGASKSAVSINGEDHESKPLLGDASSESNGNAGPTVAARLAADVSATHIRRHPPVSHTGHHTSTTLCRLRPSHSPHSPPSVLAFPCVSTTTLRFTKKRLRHTIWLWRYMWPSSCCQSRTRTTRERPGTLRGGTLQRGVWPNPSSGQLGCYFGTRTVQLGYQRGRQLR